MVRNPVSDPEANVPMRIPNQLGRRRRQAPSSNAADDARAPSDAVASVLKLIPEPAIAVDPEGNVAEMNLLAERLFVRSRADAVGSPVRSLIPHGWPAKHGDGRRGRATRAAGGEFDVEIVTNRLGGFGSRWTVAIVRDVSARVLAERLLSAEKEVLEMVASGAPLVLVLETLARNIETLSPGMSASILLIAEDGTLRHGVAPSLPTAYLAAVDGVPIAPNAGSCGTAAFRKKMVVVADIASDRLWRDYREIALRYGLRACWSNPIMSQAGEVMGTFALYYDEPRHPSPHDLALVDRATYVAGIAIGHDRAERQRLDIESRYRTLAELTSDFAYAFSLDERGGARVEWATDAFTRITGYDIHEWEQRGGWLGLLYPDDVLQFQQRMPRLMRGEPTSGEVRIVTKTGEIRWLHVFSKPVWDDDQKRIVGIVGAAQDFTARKEAEDARTMFLATASHELKTPLTVIQGFAQFLNKPASPEGIQQEAMEAIERRAIQLNKIVDRILLSSRIETGRARLALSEVDILPAVSERVSALRAATARDVVLAADVPAAIASADLDAVVTVVDHLLENAVKYSPNGEQVRLGVLEHETTYELCVSDHGIGMTPEQLSHCTEKFWQAESTDVRRFGGTGIGLYIVRSLVEAMGGELLIESAPGAGSTFTVVLRRALEATEPGEHAADLHESQPSVIREFMRQIGIPERRER